jgi:hypothetical protein
MRQNASTTGDAKVRQCFRQGIHMGCDSIIFTTVQITQQTCQAKP